MRLKSILFFNISLLLFSFAALLVTIANNDPGNSGFSIFIVFYVSFFISVLFALTLIIFFIRSRISNNLLSLGFYFPSLRQALFLSLAMTILLLLKGVRILDWWIGVSIFIAFIFLELFFETKRFKNNAGKY